MRQVYHLDDFLEHEENKTIKDRVLYLSLSFRPASTLIICIILTVIIAVPCIILLINNPATSVAYNIAFAILTGVVASGLVSIAIELATNYRHNYQRLLVLHEYLLTVANYEKHIEFCEHGRTDDDCHGIFTARTMAAAELILEIGPVVEAAYKDGKEFMSLEEMKYVISAVEAASRIGDIADSFVYDQMTEYHRIGDFYEKLSEPFKTKLIGFAEGVSISIVPEHLNNVVADYILEHPEELEELDQYDLYRALESFDDAMSKLQTFVKNEPGYYIELIPWEQRFKKIDKKFKKEHEKVEKETLEMLHKAVEKGYMTKAEYEEFLQIDEEISKHTDFDMDEIYNQAGVDYSKATTVEELDVMDEKVDAVMDKIIKRRSEERFKKMMRVMQILTKAEGRNIEMTPDMWMNEENHSNETCL